MAKFQCRLQNHTSSPVLTYEAENAQEAAEKYVYGLNLPGPALHFTLVVEAESVTEEGAKTISCCSVTGPLKPELSAPTVPEPPVYPPLLTSGEIKLLPGIARLMGDEVEASGRPVKRSVNGIDLEANPGETEGRLVLKWVLDADKRRFADRCAKVTLAAITTAETSRAEALVQGLRDELEFEQGRIVALEGVIANQAAELDRRQTQIQQTWVDLWVLLVCFSRGEGKDVVQTLPQEEQKAIDAIAQVRAYPNSLVADILRRAFKKIYSETRPLEMFDLIQRKE